MNGSIVGAVALAISVLSLGFLIYSYYSQNRLNQDLEGKLSIIQNENTNLRTETDAAKIRLDELTRKSENQSEFANALMTNLTATEDEFHALDKRLTSVEEVLNRSSDAIVTHSAGLTLSNVTSAFGDPNTKESMGIHDILVFVKSGGSPEGGNLQPLLRTDLPPIQSATGNISFQYFVDVKNDLTGPNSFHCSDTRLHVFLDKKEVYLSDWLGYQDRTPALPLDTGKVTLADMSSYPHELSFLPESRNTGCNSSGYVLSWGGTIAVFQ
jgi:hypothetical protein